MLITVQAAQDLQNPAHVAGCQHSVNSIKLPDCPVRCRLEGSMIAVGMLGMQRVIIKPFFDIINQHVLGWTLQAPPH